MKISYDAEVDALSITFRDATVTTKHLAEGIAADYDSEGRLAGLEILDAQLQQETGAAILGYDAFLSGLILSPGGLVVIILIPFRRQRNHAPCGVGRRGRLASLLSSANARRRFSAISAPRTLAAGQHG